MNFIIQNLSQHPTPTFINTSNDNTRLGMADKPTGYPRCWLNDQGHVKCVARGCHQVWRTKNEIRGRTRYCHLRNGTSDEHGPHTATDHSILLAMSMQRKCPRCSDFTLRNHRSIKDLWKHELDVHGTEYTSRISVFVVLLRDRALEPEVAHMAYEAVHQRLLQKIMAWSEYHGPLGLANFWHIRYPDHRTNMRVLESIITTPNEKEGKPLYYPMVPTKFLSDLPPEPVKRQIAYDWAGMGSRLRQMYANGQI